MENLTIDTILQFVEIHRYAGYFILFIAMVLEGETVLILAAMLAQLKAFDIGDVLWISFLGVVFGNVIWYYVGKNISSKGFAKNMIIRAEKIIIYFLPRFREKPFKSIFVSKFIYGANRATVFMSGVLKVDFALFVKAEFFASIAWVTLYASVGYFFGYAAIQITHKAGYFALLILVFVVVFILLQKLFVFYYERREHQKLEKDSNSQR